MSPESLENGSRLLEQTGVLIVIGIYESVTNIHPSDLVKAFEALHTEISIVLVI